MERKAVESSMIRSIGYDEPQKVLEVEFMSGGVYQYAGVEPQEHRALVEAPSMGQYFSREIKGKHQFKKS